MTRPTFEGAGSRVVDSGMGNPTVEAVDVASLRVQYLTAFERYCAYAAKLLEHTEHDGAPLLQQLDEERQALEDLAAMRCALLDALAAFKPQVQASIVAETRDEVIRRSIAKRSQGLAKVVRRLRLSLPRRIA